MSSGPLHIGKYEILSELGRGGMGTVYRARDPVLDRVLALKTMSPSILAEQGMRERFLREARSAARLQHTNIVIIYEFGEVDGSPFIAMELLEGDDLADAVEKGRLPDLPSRLGVLIQLCDALAYAHRHGVIHRDVKPANIHVLPGGAIKVVDFGIASLEGAGGVTRTGVLLGTPSYMAPEQFAGEGIDHRVDQWAVGVLLYELVSGRRPFEANTVPSLIYRILHSQPPPLETRHLQVPRPLVAIVEQALAKEPAQRFPDLDAMGRALRAVRDTLTAAVPGLGPPPPPLPVQPAQPPAVTTPAAPAAPTPRPSMRLPASGRMSFVEEAVFGEPRKLQTVILSPDESTLVAGGTDGAIYLWDLGSHTRVETLRNRVHMRTGHGALTTSLVFSEDGSLLVSAHLDGAIYLWEVESGLELDVRLGHDGAVGGIALPPGGRALVSGGADATLKFWDLQALRRSDARRELRRQPDAITCLGLAGQGRVVVTGHANRSLRVHEATGDHRLVATLHGHRSPVAALSVSPAGDLVASGGRDGAVRIHHVATREVTAVYQEHGRAVSAIGFFPDGRRVASVAMDSSLVIWDPAQPEMPVVLTGKPDESFAGLCVTADGRRVICACADGRIRVWHAA
ncbi:MAG: WD40 repeat domain-containing serine/threonine protein kinase [Thermoanaerobaculaceae bacterium]